MARLVETPPEECSNGHQWDRPYSYLVGWDNQREVPCRVYVCRSCDDVVYP